MAARQGELLGDKPPRKRPIWRAHWADVGCGETVPPPGMTQYAQFECTRCGWESKWMWMENVTAVKRGIPCPQCNKGKTDEQNQR